MFCVFIWLRIFCILLNFWFGIISFFVNRYNPTRNFKWFKKICEFLIGVELFSGICKPTWILKWDQTYVEKLLIDRYITMWLYSYSCNAAYFYDMPFKFIVVQKFKHSFFLELIWAGFPTIIVLLILAPSLYLLYSIDEELDPSVTVKVVGHQWFWTYELNNWFAMFKTVKGVIYSKYWKLEFDSILVNEEFLTIGMKRLLEVTKSLVLPINVPIRFLITSADVLHSWSVPELGLKIDAVPGRLNQFVSVICRLGRLYGQCSELCGVSHGLCLLLLMVCNLSHF